MLTDHVERYVALRQALGFKLRSISGRLHAFARFATARGDSHIRAPTVVDWAAQASSPGARHVRLRDAVHLARFLHAEDPAHEVPPPNHFPAPATRPLPYIYTPAEIVRIIEAAGRLRPSKPYPLRGRTYATLLGLIAATGLRVSEALNLRMGDVLPDGVLSIRRTKFAKSRLVPLHTTVADALDRYLQVRCRLAATDDHVFLSASGRRISAGMVNYTFRRILRLAAIVPARRRPPRIHDLRHTFATRALERCPTRREAVGRHFVALATYLGHADIAHTYWYLQATPELMTDIAATVEALVAKEDP
jgi:integrase/recombinase XerD